MYSQTKQKTYKTNNPPAITKKPSGSLIEALF